MYGFFITFWTILLEFNSFWMISLVFCSDVIFVSAFCAAEDDIFTHFFTPPMYFASNFTTIKDRLLYFFKIISLINDDMTFMLAIKNIIIDIMMK